MGGDPSFALTAWQQGQLEVRYNPQDQVDANWISDTLFVFYGNEADAVHRRRDHRPGHAGLDVDGPRARVPLDQLRPQPVLHHGRLIGPTATSGSATATSTTTAPTSPPRDICDDWKPLGDPGHQRSADGSPSTAPTAPGGTVSAVERAPSDTNTLWAATSTGRVFVSKNADDPNPAAVMFDRHRQRLDTRTIRRATRRRSSSTATNPNHAWITYSGYNSKTPDTPGHVFEVVYVPGQGPSRRTFTNLDGHKINGYGDIPANSIIVTNRGTIYVGNDYGVVAEGAELRLSGSCRRPVCPT